MIESFMLLGVARPRPVCSVVSSIFISLPNVVGGTPRRSLTVSSLFSHANWSAFNPPPVFAVRSAPASRRVGMTEYAW
ncbi:hypothetical protein BO99DRAFT_149391 [Aspergillus violaceofuscus CBS 115571]|uniref:Uncharacterized protein n=1 Tax=Aspergillus violaceofuscus (strain CBS 115571) TaxID=1450538 RepID=A0A2V5H9Y4_ASPV1|nr:hypothetical protein BO99DRAFT_149391 [Aspergillus violaceofuscus CBS 115571]